MKFTITGSLGKISKPLATTLVKAGHTVTLISSNPDKAEAITALGAIPAIGSVDDLEFITKAFTGADAIYTMVPPTFATTNYREYISGTGKIYAQAIQAAGVQHVVNLSSIGADHTDGTGPIKGLHDVEQLYNALEGVAIVHLRPAYFFTNFYASIDMIKHAGIMGSNVGAADTMVMAHLNDIAAVAATIIQEPFTGKSIRYITSDERTAGEVASVLGAAIGKPELPWIEFTNEQAFDGMVQAGLPEEVAKNYVEMGDAIRTGKLWIDYNKNKPELSKTKLEDFAKEFASQY
ncbi:NAD(P)H-binding protein [Flavobacterium kingsejongi]|uniref:NAD-dependent dehydratase n=1 Tax=Flavobacterium kingsejongi TaxID=1678728 RepID=A0A2S1LQX1_9FLAO|nr:NAD(P)H-binding protein [Flavobacterium kingsejongi]AWG26155.1 NAD-dependent dehydratase [Flavobacterium kingsejongi]